MNKSELLKKTPAELVDMGICPTCLNRECGGALYGSDEETLVYRDEDIECFFVGNPRARGHMAISTETHYHDMSEAPDELNAKIVKYSAFLMRAIKEVYACERVYLCTMCDGPMNHYHVQLIPRYSEEKRGSKNFVKPRSEYVFERDRFEKIKSLLSDFSKN
jgi:diadenosine tetraphosphate (Ap4A) HIT family hydrolase